MAKLPVVDDNQRQGIREALAHYKKQHGNVGDPELQQRIMYVLGLTDAEMPLSTLQRFMKNKVRTDDRMVRRYLAFLGKVGGEGFAEQLAAVLHDQILWPSYPPRWDILEFEGRYEFSLFDDDSEFEKGAMVMLPATTPHVLCVWHEYANDTPDAEADWGVVFGPRRGAFLQSSIDHFTLAMPSMRAVTFAGLALTACDPVTLEGTELEAGYHPVQPPGSYRIRMVKTQGPRLKIDKTPRTPEAEEELARIGNPEENEPES